MKDTREYQAMSVKQFEEAVRHMPVFFVPLGLLEWHGEHLPLGTDILKAHGICLRLAQELGGGLVLPPIYCGRPGFSSYPGTLTFSESLVNGLLYELMGQLQKVGAKIIVLLTGHYGPLQVDCVKRVADCFQRECPKVKVIAQAEYENVLVQGEIPADHAGKWETSLMYALHPEVATAICENTLELQVPQYKTPQHDYYKESAQWTWCNEVTHADAHKGMEALKQIEAVILKQIRQALHEQNQ